MYILDIYIDILDQIMINDKISIFGSSGFIGSNFVKLFPTSVVQISKESNISSTDNVLYFISTTHNYHIFDNPYLDIETNLNKLISVLEEFRKNNKTGVFNFISSWFVYGMNCTLDTKESDYCIPTGFYSITKRAAEQMLICYCETYNINYRILRLTNIIGENDANASLKKNAIQYMIDLLKKDKLVKLYDGGSHIRDPMHVHDACRAIHNVLQNAPVNEIINISNSKPISIKEIIDYSKEKLNSNSVIESINQPEFHKVVQVKNVCLNNNKLLSYGYKSQINTYEALDTILVR